VITKIEIRVEERSENEKERRKVKLFSYYFQSSAVAGAILNILPGPYNKKYR
jgi:hypothetical protein